MNGSIVGWLDGHNADIITRLESAAGVPATTMSTGIDNVLSELDTWKVAVVTSWNPTTYGVAVDALTELGYNVDCYTLDRRGDVFDNVQLTTDRIFRFTVRNAKKTTDPDCALLLGGSVPALTLINDLEYELDILVVSDGQAALFNIFRTMDVDPIDGYSKLLRRA